MQELDWTGATEKHSKSGQEEGEEMTREDVVQAALTVERWCFDKWRPDGACDCPFRGSFNDCLLEQGSAPRFADLEKYLRSRGMNDERE